MPEPSHKEPWENLQGWGPASQAGLSGLWRRALALSLSQTCESEHLAGTVLLALTLPLAPNSLCDSLSHGIR